MDLIKGLGELKNPQFIKTLNENVLIVKSKSYLTYKWVETQSGGGYVSDKTIDHVEYHNCDKYYVIENNKVIFQGYDGRDYFNKSYKHYYDKTEIISFDKEDIFYLGKEKRNSFVYNIKDQKKFIERNIYSYEKNLVMDIYKSFKSCGKKYYYLRYDHNFSNDDNDRGFFEQMFGMNKYRKASKTIIFNDKYEELKDIFGKVEICGEKYPFIIMHEDDPKCEHRYLFDLNKNDKANKFNKSFNFMEWNKTNMVYSENGSIKSLDLKVEPYNPPRPVVNDLAVNQEPPKVKRPPIEQNECAICFEDIVTKCVLDPCGHMNICIDCAKLVPKCSICRTKIDKVIKAY